MRRLFSFFAVAFLSACAPTIAGETKCLQDTNCGFGFICDHNLSCEADNECPAGSLCGDQDNGTKLCQIDNNLDGNLSSTETSLAVEAEGVCSFVPCEATEECPSGFTCVVEAGQTRGECQDLD